MIKFGKDSHIRHKLAFAAVCIAVNIAGKYFTDSLELPFWLDTAGTCLSACILGPWYGAAVGLISNLAMGISDFIAVLYCLINAGIGIITGYAAKRKMFRDLFNILCLSVITGFFSVICAVPLNCAFNNGMINNKWGDALFQMLENYSISVPLRSICGQAFIDIPDKVVTLLAVFLILDFLKKQGLVSLDEEKLEEQASGFGESL